MHNRSLTGLPLWVALGLFIAGCGDSGTDTSPDASASGESTLSTADDGSATTATPTTDAVTNTTIDGSIFDPNRVGDLRELDSFVFTIDESHVSNGSPSSRSTTVGYIKDPRSAYVLTDLGEFGAITEYWVDGRVYQRDHQNYWTMYEDGSLAAPDLLNVLNNEYALAPVQTAVFAGEQELGGIPAYHFTFDETNLFNFSSYGPDNPSPETEGDFYLAKDGRYPLYVHSRTVAAGAGYELIDEYTETLSDFNQVAAITLPADMQPLKDDFDQGLTFAIPMPTEGKLDRMINYNDGGIGVWYFQYTSPWSNEAEFIAFYTGLAPTNGWEVSHIGRVHNLDAFCADGNCVIMKNADKQFILYFDGSNLHADYDREHQFSPE